MNRYFKNLSLDANHAEIVAALKAAGHDLIDLASLGQGVSDLVVSARLTRIAVAMEIKTAGGHFRLNQLRFIAGWKGHAAFVRTAEEALRVMDAPEKYSLTNREKDAILALCVRYEQEFAKKRVKVGKIYVRRFEKDLKAVLERKLESEFCRD